jgi:hypothetical protein
MRYLIKISVKKFGRPMKSYHVIPTLILFLVISLLIQGCDKTDSSDTVDNQKKTPLHIGTWQQTAVGEQDVSGMGVKMIITEHALTMEAPNCTIQGKYTIAGDMLTLTITSVEGDACSGSQKIGGGGSVQFTVTESQLTMYPAGADNKNQADVYTRLSQSPS